MTTAWPASYRRPSVHRFALAQINEGGIFIPGFRLPDKISIHLDLRLCVCVTSGDMQMLRPTAELSNELIKPDIPIEAAAHNGSTI